MSHLSARLFLFMMAFPGKYLLLLLSYALIPVAYIPIQHYLHLNLQLLWILLQMFLQFLMLYLIHLLFWLSSTPLLLLQLNHLLLLLLLIHPQLLYFLSNLLVLLLPQWIWLDLHQLLLSREVTHLLTNPSMLMILGTTVNQLMFHTLIMTSLEAIS